MADYYLYTALAGDTFDAVALDFYNEESRATILLQANPAYRKVLLFSGGEQIRVPIISTTAASDTLPPWKRVIG